MPADSSETESDPEVEALFELAPEEFTAARDALAKRRRADKPREAADAIKKLRRPTVTAWALNQVARRHGDAVGELTAAAEALSDAQEKALGGEREPFRAAQARQRDVLRRLHDLAADIVRERGGAAGVLDEVDAALRAAVADPAAAAEVRAGRLSVPPESSGGFGGALAAFGLGAPDDGGATSSAPIEPAEKPGKSKKADKADRQAKDEKKPKKAKRANASAPNGDDAASDAADTADATDTPDATDDDAAAAAEQAAEARRQAQVEARRQAQVEARLAARSASLARSKAGQAQKAAEKSAARLEELEEKLRKLQAEVDAASAQAADDRQRAEDAIADADTAEARADRAEADAAES